VGASGVWVSFVGASLTTESEPNDPACTPVCGSLDAGSTGVELPVELVLSAFAGVIGKTLPLLSMMIMTMTPCLQDRLQLESHLASAFCKAGNHARCRIAMLGQAYDLIRML